MVRTTSGFDYRPASETLAAGPDPNLSQYGPDQPCQRKACIATARHNGGAHLDPRSEHYDGPDTQIGALTHRVRPYAFQLLHLARRAGWNVHLVQLALHTMTDEIHRLGEQIAAARVDRDRGIRAAAERAENCDVHGADLRYERHQAYWLWMQGIALDEQRTAWLSAVHNITQLVADDSDNPATRAILATAEGQALAKAIRSIAAAAGRSQERIRRRYDGPTQVACAQAGQCEHPAPPPHVACQPEPAATQ